MAQMADTREENRERGVRCIFISHILVLVIAFSMTFKKKSITSFVMYVAGP